MTHNNRIIEAIKNKILAEYKDDVSLLVLYNYQEDSDKNIGLDFYFIPKTEKAYPLSTQFIVDGISYDLFPMNWDRLVKIAAMDSPQAYLFLSAKVIYSSDEQALLRFNKYTSDLENVLSGDYDEAMLNKSYEYFNETYIYLYNMLHYCKRSIDTKLESSKVLDQIANALAFANSTYYNGGHGSAKSIIESSFSLEKLPLNYEELVRKIIFSNDMEEIFVATNELINNTRLFLHGQKELTAQPEPFETFFIGYYEELKSIINRFIIAANNKDYIKLFSLAAYIHEELSQFMMKVESGLWYNDRNVYSEYSKIFDDCFNIDFFQLINDKNDEAIINGMVEFENKFVALLTKNNINLLSFDSLEAFEDYFQNK